MIDLVASRRGGGIAIIQSITQDTTKKAGSADDFPRPLVEPCMPSGSGDAARRAVYLRPTDSSFEA
jgi:hypothetical protein